MFTPCLYKQNDYINSLIICLESLYLWRYLLYPYVLSRESISVDNLYVLQEHVDMYHVPIILHSLYFGWPYYVANLITLFCLCHV